MSQGAGAGSSELKLAWSLSASQHGENRYTKIDFITGCTWLSLTFFSEPRNLVSHKESRIIKGLCWQWPHQISDQVLWMELRKPCRAQWGAGSRSHGTNMKREYIGYSACCYDKIPIKRNLKKRGNINFNPCLSWFHSSRQGKHGSRSVRWMVTLWVQTGSRGCSACLLFFLLERNQCVDVLFACMYV